MDTKEFLQHVLGDSGYYCVFAVRNTDKRLTQKFYNSIDELIDGANKLDKNGFDAYFALGTMMTPESRKAENVLQMRAFFLDLDCGADMGDKGFPSQQAAITSLRQFVQTYHLPKPTIVNSGGGIHAYWPLDRPVPRDEWLPWAERFKRLCQMHKLPVDPVVPADAARVLRIPRTHNYGYEAPRVVRVLGEPGKLTSLDEMRAILEFHSPRSALPDPRPDRPTTDPLMRALAGNVTNRFRTILEKCKLGKGCAQILHVVTHQAEIAEPLWRAGLSVAVQCIDGEKAIHMMSRQHPDYNPDATIQKAALTKGPYHCTSFDELNPGKCTDCPHWGKITSPIQLGREVMAAEEKDNIVFDKPERIPSASLQEYIIPQYPAPYFRGKNGGIYLRTKNKEEEDIDVCIYHNDMYVVSRVIDPDTGDGIVVRLHMPFDGVREFSIPLTAVTSKEDLRKYLSKNGVPVSNVTVLMDYLLKWVTKLEHTTAADAARLQFGWTSDDMPSFALGRSLIFKDRVEPNAPSRTTAPRFSTFEQRGSLSGWKAAMEFYNRPGFEPWQYAVGCFFGSVLMRMLPIHGTVFHLHSKGSGRGKTTALIAGASIWGSPSHYILKENDTQYSRMMRAEVWKDLPVAVDEMTNILPADASDFLYQIPSGMQRNRMAATGNAERYRGDPWKLICVTTGNTSLIERVSRFKDLPKAEAQRVLECRVYRKQFRSKQETDLFSASLNANYGHAGIPYLQYVMEHHDRTMQSLFQVQRDIDTQAGLVAENRFWSAQTACVIVGTMLARKLGLVNYDIKGLFRWVVDDLLATNKANTQGSKQLATDVITEYLAAHYNGFLRLRSTDDLRGRPPSGLDHLVVPTAVPKGALYGRHEEDTNVLYLLPKPLRQWCVDRQIDYTGLLHDLKRGSTEAKMVKVRLTKGTKVSMPPVNALMLRGDGWMTDDTQKDLAEQAEENE